VILRTIEEVVGEREPTISDGLKAASLCMLSLITIGLSGGSAFVRVLSTCQTKGDECQDDYCEQYQACVKPQTSMLPSTFLALLGLCVLRAHSLAKFCVVHN
jgi:hypothetical protein